jgi:hypothetical protein
VIALRSWLALLTIVASSLIAPPSQSIQAAGGPGAPPVAPTDTPAPGDARDHQHGSDATSSTKVERKTPSKAEGKDSSPNTVSAAVTGDSATFIAQSP